MSSGAVRRADLGGQLKLETSVLRTLCLTVNSDGSELKYRILEDLTEDDFYFPVTRTIFTAVCEMHKDGDHVVAGSLVEVLNERSVDVPDDFYVDDLFKGELPSMTTLSGWIDHLKADPGETAGASAAAGSQPSGELMKTHPSVSSSSSSSAQAAAKPATEAPPPKPKEPPKPPVRDKIDLSDEFSNAAEAVPSNIERGPTNDDPLTPESGQWLGFLAELTKKQAEHLRTGFSGLDREWGGLAPGLLLLAGEDGNQLADFLKQLVDQVAMECRGPCLYVSFERSKASLRLYTLSRLSGAPTGDIEKGNFGKDSARWQEVVRAGEHAVEWLQRIYVVEARPGLSVTRIRELRQNLLDSGAGAPRLIAVDNLEKLENQSDLLHSVAELKELAEAFGIAVVGAATQMELVHERSADMAATLQEEAGQCTVKISSAESREPAVLRFEYRPELHRFTEPSR